MPVYGVRKEINARAYIREYTVIILEVHCLHILTAPVVQMNLI